jgi:transposase
LCADFGAPLEESSSTRVLIMDDHSDDIRRPLPPRIEVCARVGRKRGPDELKAQIVVESFRPGAVVTDIARRHGCRPQQVHGWRRMARLGQLVLPASADTGSCPWCRNLRDLRPRSDPYRRKPPPLRLSCWVHG